MTVLEHADGSLRGRQGSRADLTLAGKAERLKQARERYGFASASAAATHLGVAYSTYAGHESGLRGFRRAEVEAYAKAFGVDVAWLEFGNGDLPSLSTRSRNGLSLLDKLTEEKASLAARLDAARREISDGEREMAVLDAAIAQLHNA